MRETSFLFALFVLLAPVREVNAQTKPFLNFPLDNEDPFTATINSVFDHSMVKTYCPDGIVEAYTGEQGKKSLGAKQSFRLAIRDCNGDGIREEGEEGTPLTPDEVSSYPKVEGGTKEFDITGNYAGAGTPGYLSYDGHPGYDYSVRTETPVHAAASGTVACVSLRVEDGADENQTEVRKDDEGQIDQIDKCTEGNSQGEVKIDHGNGYYTIYMHLSRADVHAGERIKTVNKQIGVSGSTGIGTGPHLHFEVRKEINGVLVPVDPYGWKGEPGEDPYRIKNENLWLSEEPEGVDVALVLDRSGSMNSNNFMEDAKSAAKTLVDLSGPGDQLAVTSFSGVAEVNVPLTLIRGDAEKDAIKQAISQINAGGITSIGAGMQKAQSELDKGDADDLLAASISIG